MSYELQNFFQTPEFSERIWLDWEPPPLPPPLSRWPKYFKSQIKGGRLSPTHAC